MADKRSRPANQARPDDEVLVRLTNKDILLLFFLLVRSKSIFPRENDVVNSEEFMRIAGRLRGAVTYDAWAVIKAAMDVSFGKEPRP